MDKKMSCIVVDDEPTAREILLNHLSKIEQIQVIGSCSGAIEAFNLVNMHQVDVIFLDINMPEISGLSFAKSINKDIKIIFTTAYREYAIDSYDLQAIDYLMKPISFERLYKAINLYFELHQPSIDQSPKPENSNQSDFMFVRADRKMVKINYADMVFIESLSDYLKIHTKTGSIITRETISNIEAKLPPQNFLRVHRSFIVSIAHITSYTHEYVEVEGNTIPIGRTNKSEVLERLERH